MKLKISAIAITCLLVIPSFTVSAQEEMSFPIKHQIDRFTDDLDHVEKFMKQLKDYPLERKIRILDSESIRDSWRNLQNAFRLYSGKKNKYSALSKYYDLSKEAEDMISHNRDLKRWAQQNDGNREVNQEFDHKYEEHTSNYLNYIQTSKWYKTEDNMVDEIRAALNKIEWPSLRADRNYLLKKIAKKMKKYSEKEYDMELVEDGIHELSRDVRRIWYFNYGLGRDGLVVSDSHARQRKYDCPIGNEPQKYTREKSNQYMCYISSCLNDEFRQARSDLNYLKRDGVRLELRGYHPDTHPEKYSQIFASAKKVLDRLKSKQVFKHVQYQIEGCRDPKVKKDNNKDNVAE